MAEDSEIHTEATPTNGNTLSVSNNNDPAWNYIWDDKLCKTTLKLFKPTVYTPPILTLPDSRDPKRYYVCPAEKCEKFFARGQKSQFRVHMKRHLPDSEKPFQCDQPACTRAFVRIDELATHKRTHTGEKPYKCEQCGRKFTRSHHLSKHLGTHIRETKSTIACSPEVSSDEFVDDDVDDDIESGDSSSFSLKQEIDTDTDTETEPGEEYHRHEMQELKVESADINEPLLPDIKITQMKEPGGDASNDFKSNDTSSTALVSINMAKTEIQEIQIEEFKVSVNQEIKTELTDESVQCFDEMINHPHLHSSDVPTHRLAFSIPKPENNIKSESNNYSENFEVHVKKEIKPETTDDSSRLFEEFVMKELKEELGIKPDFPDIYSSNEPTSMSAAIHRLAFPNPTNTYENKSDSMHKKNIQSKSEPKNNIQSKTKTTNNIESESKLTEKRYKCSEEECDLIHVKEEIKQLITDDSSRLFEKFVMKELKEEPEMKPDFPDIYSSNEPTSMSAAIHRLVFPIPIPTNEIESESQHKKNIHSKSKPKNNIHSKTKPTNNIESESKLTEKRYKCSEEGCDRAFKVPYGLKRHSWVHTKVKTFECDQCKKKFLRKDHLGKHLKTHSR